MFKQFGANDISQPIEKIITKGMFNGAGTLDGASMATQSIASGQKDYYLTVTSTSSSIAIPHFDVGYGHSGGSGSVTTTDLDNIVYGPSQAVYKQCAALTLHGEDRIFQFTSGSDQHDVYVFSAKRSSTLERINAGYWTLELSGSSTAGTKTTLKLTDDSLVNDGEGTIAAGIRYYIYSGSNGSLSGSTANGDFNHDGTAATIYGFCYPDIGLIVLDANAVSSSLGGTHANIASPTGSGTYAIPLNNGMTPDLRVDGYANNALRFVSALKKGSVTMRSEQITRTVQHYVRIRNDEFNWSVHPSYVTGALGTDDAGTIIDEMKYNPQTFITTVGLYDGGSDTPVAVARLSKPLQNSFELESIIKVNLEY